MTNLQNSDFDEAKAKMETWAAANPEEYEKAVTEHLRKKAQYGALMVLDMLEQAIPIVRAGMEAAAEGLPPGQPRDFRKESEVLWRIVIADLREMFGDLQSAIEQSEMDDKSDREPPLQVM